MHCHDPLIIKEQAILLKGEEDGRFDPQDSVQFYAEGQDTSYAPGYLRRRFAGRDRLYDPADTWKRAEGKRPGQAGRLYSFAGHSLRG